MHYIRSTHGYAMNKLDELHKLTTISLTKESNKIRMKISKDPILQNLIILLYHSSIQ